MIVAGTVLLVVGIALLVLPGPGIPLIVAGLALLGTQFPRALEWLRARAKKAVAAVRARDQQTP